ncbi:MAG: corrinoid protein [Oscillospiraceae bacterium]|nr:corrinoid protein [Oscillospiraceae bacterium]
MPVLELPEIPRRRTAPKVEAAAAPVLSPEDDELLSALAEALYRGRKAKVASLVAKALEAGTDPQLIIQRGLIPGMDKLGEEFSAGRAFVPEMLMGGRCMNAAMELIKPRLVTGTAESAGRVVLGTVRGDLHDIGKNLVKIMMEGTGLEVIDLGVDVAPEDFVHTAIERDCGLIACSSLLTTAMNEMRSVVKLAEEAGIRGRVKIMVGGAPITQGFCEEIGADAYTDDAAEAARVAIRLLAG